MTERPAHSLLLVAFDAEESGDLGSNAWVAAPPVPLAELLVDVNMDMVGRNAKNQLYAAGPTQVSRAATARRSDHQRARRSG